MENTIISVNIGNLENEINAITEQILKLQREKDEKIGFKNSILRYAVPNSVKTPSVVGTYEQSNIKLETTDLRSEPDHQEPTIGVSDFILNYLKEHKRETSTNIIQAYGKIKKKGYTVVRNNVSNALSRLKSAGKIIAVDVSTVNGTTFILNENEAKIA